MTELANVVPIVLFSVPLYLVYQTFLIYKSRRSLVRDLDAARIQGRQWRDEGLRPCGCRRPQPEPVRVAVRREGDHAIGRLDVRPRVTGHARVSFARDLQSCRLEMERDGGTPVLADPGRLRLPPHA